MLDLQMETKTISKHAVAQMQGKDGKVSGTATFTEYDVEGWKYVHIKLELKGAPEILTAGNHAVHIHEKADCSDPDFKCAGGHFDPGPSGNSDPDVNHGYHAGDLPNITIGNDGTGILETISTRITLSDGPVSILSKDSAPDGTSLMVHANTDPYKPGESGSGISGGPRLACGPIKAT